MKKTAMLTAVFMALITISGLAQNKVEKGNYYFRTTIPAPLEEATSRVKSALQEEGFGIVSELNMHKTFREKLGKEIEPYRILGVCNASFAWKTIQREENIGVFLPCKVLIKEKGEQKTEIVAVNPSHLVKILENPELNGLGDEITQRFHRALKNL